MVGRISTQPDRLGAWQASTGRAKEEKVRVWHTKRMGWRAHSSKSSEIYTMKTHHLENGSTGLSCSCAGYVYRNYCKHIARLAIVLANKGEEVRLL